MKKVKGFKRYSFLLAETSHEFLEASEKRS